MRRSRRPVPRPSLALLLGLLAAACGDDDPGLIARPHELRLTIVRGEGMRVPVRPVDTPAGEVPVSDEPVIVEVSALIGASEQARAGATGPALEVRMPAVELRWRALQRWCEPLHAVTPLTRGDTVHNHYRRPTLADGCLMVVEGVSEGLVFDADTAFVQFDPGPLVAVHIPDQQWLLVGLPHPKTQFAAGGRDAYDNRVVTPPVSITLTENPSLFALADTAVFALGEGVGAAMVTSGAFTQRVELWGLPNLETHAWRLSWGCDDLARPGGARADSIRFAMDSAVADFGSHTNRGRNVAFIGRVVMREWRTGEPARTTNLANYSVFGTLRPLVVEWTPGQVSQRTPTGFAGASLCEQTLGGPAGRAVPVRVDRR